MAGGVASRRRAPPAWAPMPLRRVGKSTPVRDTTLPLVVRIAVNPGVHSVPADPEHTRCGAGGTSVTEIRFLGPAALAAPIKLHAPAAPGPGFRGASAPAALAAPIKLRALRPSPLGSRSASAPAAQRLDRKSTRL